MSPHTPPHSPRWEAPLTRPSRHLLGHHPTHDKETLPPLTTAHPLIGRPNTHLAVIPLKTKHSKSRNARSHLFVTTRSTTALNGPWKSTHGWQQDIALLVNCVIHHVSELKCQLCNSPTGQRQDRRCCEGNHWAHHAHALCACMQKWARVGQRERPLWQSWPKLRLILLCVMECITQDPPAGTSLQ